MKKIKALLIILLFVVAGVLIYFNVNNLNLIYDDYLLVDDFSVLRPIFTEQHYVSSNDPPRCEVYSGGWSWLTCDNNGFYCEAECHTDFGRCNPGARHCWDDKYYISEINNYAEVSSHTNGIIALSASGNNNNAILKLKQNIKNYNLRIKFRLSVGTRSDSSCGETIIMGFSGDNISNSFGSHQFLSKSLGTIQHGQDEIADYLVEIEKNPIDEDIFIVTVNGDSETATSFTYTNDEAYLIFQASGGWCGGTVIVDYIKYKPYNSCDTDNNEVWVTDSFGEGSVFDIHSLTYEPTKFCPLDYPAVVRDYREQGVRSDSIGTITQGLVTGQSYTVPQYQSYEIRYATKYQEGIVDRCELGEVYDTTTNQCVQKVFEQNYIIKDCNTNPEICPAPNTCELRNNAYVCVTTENVVIERNCLSNPEICDETYGEYCDTARLGYPVCVRTKEVIKIINEKEYIIVGETQTTFENAVWIGDKFFNSDRPSYSCDKSEDWNVPQPEKSCWVTTANFNDKSYSFNPDSNLDINKYMDLTLSLSAHYDHEDDEVDSYKNTFILNLKNRDGIKLSVTPRTLNDYYVIKDSKKQFCFTLNNDLGLNFNVDRAGYLLTKTTDLITTQSRDFINKEIKVGVNEYCIDVDTNMYGEVIYTVLPYIKINNKIFFDDEQITRNYNVVDKVPEEKNITIIETSDCRESGCSIGECSLLNNNWVCYKQYDNIVNKVPTYIYVIGGVLLMIIIFLIIVRRKK